MAQAFSADTTPKSMERPRKQPEINEFRRAALMDGMIQSLAEFGVAGTTVRTICDAAGVSRGLINHYYDAKEDLMAAALRHLFGQISETVGKRLDAVGDRATDRLRAFPKALFHPNVFTERNRTAFLCFWHEARFNDKVRLVNKDLYVGYAARLERLFSDAAQECQVSIDAKAAADGLIGLSDGLWLGLSIHDTRIRAKNAADTCIRFIDRELSA